MRTKTNLIATLVFALMVTTFTVNAQEEKESYSMVEVTYMKAKIGMEKAFEAAVKSHNEKYHKEGDKILPKIRDSFVIALAINGLMFTSEDLASKIESIKTYNASHITFVIGGSLGLSNNILNIVDLKMSFSKMTFPHQLMRLILLEQIYRSFRINNNEPYHK